MASRPLSRAARVRADIRSMGAAGWAAYAVDRSLERVSRGRVRFWAFLFYAQPVPDGPLLPPARAGRMRVGTIGAADVPVAAFERPPGAVEQRFRDGSVCIAALDGEALAGFMWLHFDRLKERLVACDFEALPPDRACWDYDFEVMPRYRLGRTFARLWDEAYRLLRERGVRTSVSWIALSNPASQRAHERMGARRIGWLLVLDLWDRKLSLRPHWPFVRFTGRGRRLHVPVTVRDGTGEAGAG